ncbi:MAG: ABC transporter permease, partial [Acidisphaera sp.]|nr:ABC transporter permease [Acidisphaera sp.]
IVLACLALGVAAIACVGSLRASVEAGLAGDGRRILGGDLEVRGGAEKLPDALRAWLRARGGRLSDVVQMRSMLVAPSGERQLVELKVVDAAWPLLGEATFDPAMPVSDALGERAGRFGLVAERLVLDRLGLRPGDAVRLGDATFVLRAAITGEPDRVASPSLLGPRALIGAAALSATGLVQPGSMVQYDLRVALPKGVDPGALVRDLRAAFPNRAWRIRDARDAVPGAIRFIDQTSVFMTLVGLTALLVGGIGVANGVRAWLDARSRSIATLRCLGASGRLVFAVCLIQVMVLAACGIAVGVAAGAVLPIAGLAVFGDLLPVPPRLGLFPVPLLLAAAYGVLTAACFSLWPLGRAMRIPGVALFRDGLLPQRARPAPGILAGTALLAMLLVALTVASGPDRRFALWFCLAAAGTLGLFRLGGAALMRTAATAPRLSAPWARLGIANLHRPGAATPLLLVSVGLGLSTLASVALIEGNVRREILQQMPAQAPSFYFIDIQDSQLAQFRGIVQHAPGVQAMEEVPSLRARIVAVNGVPAEQVQVSPDTAWALRGDRGLTYAAIPPPGTHLAAGAWWPQNYAGPPLVSFDAALARGWHVGLGDSITANVLGRDIVLHIASLRDIDWRSLSLNFALVASPGLLADAPHTHIATVRVDPADEGSLLRAVTDALPNVSGISVQEVLRAVAALLGQLGAALAATGSLTLAAGALVLAGAVAAGQRRRTREAVILKTLGATRAQIRAAWLVEFSVLGGCAGLIAASVGALASFAVLRYVMGAGWTLLPATLAATILACIALMLVFGYAGTAAALRAKAAPLLRNE